MLDIEKSRYLDAKIDATTTVRDATGTQFVGFILKKIDGQNPFDSRVAALSGLAQGYPGKTMLDDDKISYLQKLESLNIVF